MNRRKFCISSAAAAISGAAAGYTSHAWAASLPPAAFPAAFPAASMPGVRLYKYIYDRRFSAGRAFGAAAERVLSTAGTVGIAGDITALWSRDLRLRWLDGDGAIAGMTTARTLFCLEQLAKDHRMRVAARCEHAIRDGGDITHLVSFVIA
jgi:hypothetical protein